MFENIISQILGETEAEVMLIVKDPRLFASLVRALFNSRFNIFNYLLVMVNAILVIYNLITLAKFLINGRKMYERRPDIKYRMSYFMFGLNIFLSSLIAPIILTYNSRHTSLNMYITDKKFTTGELVNIKIPDMFYNTFQTVLLSRGLLKGNIDEIFHSISSNYVLHPDPTVNLLFYTKYMHEGSLTREEKNNILQFSIAFSAFLVEEIQKLCIASLIGEKDVEKLGLPLEEYQSKIFQVEFWNFYKKTFAPKLQNIILQYSPLIFFDSVKLEFIIKELNLFLENESKSYSLSIEYNPIDINLFKNYFETYSFIPKLFGENNYMFDIKPRKELTDKEIEKIYNLYSRPFPEKLTLKNYLDTITNINTFLANERDKDIKQYVNNTDDKVIKTLYENSSSAKRIIQEVGVASYLTSLYQETFGEKPTSRIIFGIQNAFRKQYLTLLHTINYLSYLSENMVDILFFFFIALGPIFVGIGLNPLIRRVSLGYFKGLFLIVFYDTLTTLFNGSINFFMSRDLSVFINTYLNPGGTASEALLNNPFAFHYVWFILSGYVIILTAVTSLGSRRSVIGSLVEGFERTIAQNASAGVHGMINLANVSIGDISRQNYSSWDTSMGGRMAYGFNVFTLRAASKSWRNFMESVPTVAINFQNFSFILPSRGGNMLRGIDTKFLGQWALMGGFGLYDNQIRSGAMPLRGYYYEVFSPEIASRNMVSWLVFQTQITQGTRNEALKQVLKGKGRTEDGKERDLDIYEYALMKSVGRGLFSVKTHSYSVSLSNDLASAGISSGVRAVYKIAKATVAGTQGAMAAGLFAGAAGVGAGAGIAAIVAGALVWAGATTAIYFIGKFGGASEAASRRMAISVMQGGFTPIKLFYNENMSFTKTASSAMNFSTILIASSSPGQIQNELEKTIRLLPAGSRVEVVRLLSDNTFQRLLDRKELNHEERLKISKILRDVGISIQTDSYLRPDTFDHRFTLMLYLRFNSFFEGVFSLGLWLLKSKIFSPFFEKVYSDPQKRSKLLLNEMMGRDLISKNLLDFFKGAEGFVMTYAPWIYRTIDGYNDFASRIAQKIQEKGVQVLNEISGIKGANIQESLSAMMEGWAAVIKNDFARNTMQTAVLIPRNIMASVYSQNKIMMKEFTINENNVQEIGRNFYTHKIEIASRELAKSRVYPLQILDQNMNFQRDIPGPVFVRNTNNLDMSISPNSNENSSPSEAIKMTYNPEDLKRQLNIEFVKHTTPIGREYYSVIEDKRVADYIFNPLRGAPQPGDYYVVSKDGHGFIVPREINEDVEYFKRNGATVIELTRENAHRLSAPYKADFSFIYTRVSGNNQFKINVEVAPTGQIKVSSPNVVVFYDKEERVIGFAPACQNKNLIKFKESILEMGAEKLYNMEFNQILSFLKR